MTAVIPATVSPTSTTSAATLGVLKRTCPPPSYDPRARSRVGSALPTPSLVRRRSFFQWTPPFLLLFGNFEVTDTQAGPDAWPLEKPPEQADDAVARDDHAGRDRAAVDHVLPGRAQPEHAQHLCEQREREGRHPDRGGAGEAAAQRRAADPDGCE